MSSPIVLIDVANVHARHYAANPAMTTAGLQCGGVIGTLYMVKKLVSDFSPKKVVFAWEGGGSTKRRAIFSEYKANRKPEKKFNRFYEDDIPDTDDNKVWQMALLAKMSSHLPICQVYTNDCEADDVIAHLCTNTFKDEEKIIVSTDRDFYQLVDDKTKIYSPQTKSFRTTEDVSKEFNGVSVNNFALAKALCGDKSDNIPGVKGLGFKTLINRFPILMSQHAITIDDVVAYARARLDEAKVYREVSSNEAVVRRNWRLVYLENCTLNRTQSEAIETQVATFEPKLDMLSFMRLTNEHGLRAMQNPHEFCSSFMTLRVKR